MTTIPPSLYKKLTTTPLIDLARGRLTGRLAWREAIEAADLPAELKTCIHQVVKKTRLWRSEKYDVARELIGHFRDGLDAGVDELTLRDRFGNTKVAAKLIRRAKIRNRPLVWHIWWRSLQAACVMCVVYLGLIVWFANQSPVISVNYLEKLNNKLTTGPQSDHAWPIYRDLWIKYYFGSPYYTGKFPQLSRTIGSGEAVQVRSTDPLWPEIKNYLRQNQALILGLREAACKPEFGITFGEQALVDPLTWRAIYADRPRRESKRVSIDDSPLVSVVMYHFMHMNMSSALLLADMDLAIEDDDAERFIADANACVGIARHLSLDGFFMSRTSSARSLLRLNARLAEALNRRPELFSNAQLIELSQVLRNQLELFNHDYVVDEWMVMDLLQRSFSDDGKGGGRLAVMGLLNLLAANPEFMRTDAIQANFVGNTIRYSLLPAVSLFHVDRTQAAHYSQRYFETFRQISCKPLWELLSAQGFDPLDQLEESRTVRNTISNFYHRVVVDRRLLIALKDQQAQTEALRVAIALELYKRQHGAYPKNLAELVPEFFPLIPVDHSTGLPLLLRYENNKPVLYGRGRDGKDDGGELPKLKANQDVIYPFLPRSWNGGQPEDWVLYPIITREPAK